MTVAETIQCICPVCGASHAQVLYPAEGFTPVGTAEYPCEEETARLIALAASEMGRKGGSRRSEPKQQAAATNGRKGGRPRKNN